MPSPKQAQELQPFGARSPSGTFHDDVQWLRTPGRRPATMCSAGGPAQSTGRCT
jgi:hypothetical protein